MSAEQLKARHSELKMLVNSTEYNFGNLVNKGTKVSATRYRSELMKIQKLTGELRKLTLDFQKSMPTKSKKKAAEPIAADAAAEEPEPQPQAEEEPVPEQPKPKRRGRKTKK
jgi:hypothetical protein